MRNTSFLPSTLQLRSVGTAVLFVLFAFSANMTAAAAPQCAHWTQPFVFRELLREAEVFGTKGQRLQFFRENPQICEEEQTSPCKTKRYLISGDRVVISHECSGWAYILYESGNRRSTGWVQLAGLRILPPDSVTLAKRAKWQNRPIEDPLDRAVATGDFNEVRHLLQSKDDIARALGYAVIRRKSRLALVLLKMGVDPKESPDSCHVVINAVHGELEVLAALLDAGFSINCTSGVQMNSPLKAFAMADRAARQTWSVMGHPADPGVEEPAAMLQLFIRHGADLNIKDAWGGTPLRATVAQNNVDIAALLLRAGADVNNYIDDSTSIGEQSGNTVLLEAVGWYGYRRDPTLIKLLLRHGADINYRNKLEYHEECDKTTSGRCTFRAQTALTRAAADGLYAVARLLLDGGANPTLTRGDGATPAGIARDSGHPQIVDLIEKYIKK